jgi:hypothetical protein
MGCNHGTTPLELKDLEPVGHVSGELLILSSRQRPTSPAKAAKYGAVSQQM